LPLSDDDDSGDEDLALESSRLDSEAAAKRGLEAKEDYNAVLLKPVCRVSPYPSLMLIRIQGLVRLRTRFI
jgi:hypothetical protein